MLQRQKLRTFISAFALTFSLVLSVRAQTTLNPIAGQIHYPGQRDNFTFDLSAPARFYFDALANISDLQWTLTGPEGAIVLNRSFVSSDAQSISDPTVLLPAGTYTLAIQSAGGTSNSYAFRFVNLAEAVPITPGTVVAKSLTPATKSDFYQFTAAAGDRFFFDRISRTGLGNLWWRLLDPYGNQVFSQGFGDVGSASSPLSLPASGRYTLLVEGYIGDPNPGSYSFNIVPEGNVPPASFTGTPLNLGDLISGNLAANSTNSYVFTLSNAARLILDSQLNTPNITWSLQGPSGFVVNQRGLNQSDGFYNFGPLNCPAGDYLLTIQATVANPFQFRLLDLAAASALTPGTTVNASFNPASSTALYRFNGTAGSRVYFDSLSTSGMPNAYWRLISPNGLVLFADYSSVSHGPVTLSISGTYTLLVEGYIGDPGNGTLNFNVVPVIDGSRALTLGSLVNGSIDYAGQRQLYSFTLPAAATLYFDSLANNSNLRWSLSGPAGTVVSDRPFTGSDSISIGSPLIALPAGDYTLSVSAVTDQTGSFQFRLFDLAAAAPLALGTVVNGNLNPSTATLAYQFTLNSPGRVFYQYLGSSGLPNAYVRLLDPYGNLISANYISSHAGPLALLAGTYTLLIEGYIGDGGSGNFSFNLVPVTDGLQALSLGNVVSGSISSPGQRQQYTFSLSSNTRFYFDALTNNSNLRWSLDGPIGNVVNLRSFNGSDSISIGNPVLVLQPGDYTLTVSGAADSTGGYQFRLFDLTTATPLTLGTVVNGSLTPALATTAYQFTLGSPGRIFYEYLSSSGLPNAYVRLVDAYGNFLAANYLSSHAGPMSLLAGTYTLLIEGYVGDGGSGNFSFNVVPVTDGSQSPILGNIITGAVSSPGQRQQYTFSLATPASLYFDALTNNSNLRWSLDGPAGNIVNLRSFNGSDSISIGNPVLALQPGNYTLTVSAAGDSTGGYQFRLFDLATAAPLILGTVVNGTLSPATATLAYKFTLASPGRIFYQYLSSSGLPNAYVRLVDAYGNFVSANYLSAHAGPMFLLAGTYTLLVEGYIGDGGSGNFSFKVVPVSDGSQSLVLGNLVSGTIASPGQHQLYTFTLASATRLYFDALTNNSNLRWALSGPIGTVVSDRSFSGSDSVSIGNPIIPLPPGDYTLTVSASADNTGSYQFRLSDLAAAPVLTIGSPITVNNFLANRTDLYRFTAAAGDQFGFHYQSASGIPNSYWRLIDPFNNQVFSGYFVTASGTNTLPVFGTYTLLLEGYIGDSGTGSYTFNVQALGNIPPTSFTGAAFAIGATVSGSLPSTSATSNYVFTLSNPSELYFDALINANFNWSLIGSSGLVVNSRSFLSSDSVDVADPLLNLPAGSYQLSIAGLAGAYQFRLLDFASASAFVPGAIVNGTLSPGNSSVFYQFAGSPGQRLYFNGQGVAGLTYQPYCRLYGPLGNIVMAQYLNSDVDSFTLSQSGSYTLTIEGRIYEAGLTGNFSFNLLPVFYPTNSLALGTTVSGTITNRGQRQFYTFTLPTDAILHFDVLSDADFIWRLDAPWGPVVNWRSFQSTDSADINDSALRLPAGAYSLAIAGNNFTVTGDYAFRLLNFTSAVPFTAGGVVSNSLAPASSTALYQFNGTTGQTLAFQNILSSGFSYQPYCRIYGPTGALLQNTYVNSFLDTFTLPQSGTYIVTVEGRIYDHNATGNYAFNLVPVTYPTNALTIGATVNGTVSTVGQRQFYTFSLAADAILHFDVLSDVDFVWRLDAPWGPVVNWRSFRSTDSADINDSALRLPAGAYTLAVAGNNFTVTGDYSFRVLNFLSAAPFTPGTVVSNALSPASGTVLYQFNGSTGQKLAFQNILSSGFNYSPYCRIYGPAGDLLQNTYLNTFLDTFTLPQSGTYTLALEGRVYDHNASGNYAFNLVPVTYPTNSLNLGATVNGTVSTVGQRQFYTFTLANDAILYFDALTDANFIWRLDAPWGQIVNWRSFISTDSSDFNDPALRLPAGSYSLAVAGSSFTVTGDYSFRVLDFANATSYTPGTVLTAPLAPADATVLYKFTGGAAERYYFDGQLASGFSYTPLCRLYAPAGNILMSQAVNADVDTFTLPQSGTYFLTVEGRVYDHNATGTYAFDLVPNPNGPPQLLYPTNVVTGPISLEISPSGNNYQLILHVSVPSSSYTVEFTRDLTTPTFWSPYWTGPVGPSLMQTIPLSITNNRSFFRATAP